VSTFTDTQTISCAKEQTEKTVFKSVGANLKTVGFSLRTLYIHISVLVFLPDTYSPEHITVTLVLLDAVLHCRSGHLKGLSHEIFMPVFLACMDASRPECEPLVVLKFL
jgi:hypothetical protein